jgi:hypothetical protein
VNLSLQRIKVLHLVAAVLVAPTPIGVLPVIMVVLFRVNNKRNLTGPRRAFVVVGAFCNLGDVGKHKFLHHRATAALARIQRVPVPI